jgi:hypothetical protein
MDGFFYRARQRRSIRRAVSAECQVVTDRHFQLVGIRALDLSVEGMLVESDHRPPLGEEVIVSLKLPGTTMWVDAEAEVMRHVLGLRRSDPSAGIGLRFTGMDSITKVLLRSSLVGRPPPAPGRRLRRDYARTVEMIHRAP